MGAALKPTGIVSSFVEISVFSPSLLIVEVTAEILDVGFKAILANIS